MASAAARQAAWMAEGRVGGRVAGWQARMGGRVSETAVKAVAAGSR